MSNRNKILRCSFQLTMWNIVFFDASLILSAIGISLQNNKQNHLSSQFIILNMNFCCLKNLPGSFVVKEEDKVKVFLCLLFHVKDLHGGNWDGDSIVSKTGTRHLWINYLRKTKEKMIFVQKAFNFLFIMWCSQQPFIFKEINDTWSVRLFNAPRV